MRREESSLDSCRADASKSRASIAKREATGRFRRASSKPGETFEQGAIREVSKRLDCTFAWCAFVGTTNYTHRKGKPKIVAYYLMTADLGTFAPNDEVDELVWLPLEHVRAHLTWERDQELFDLVLEMPELRALAS